MNENIINVLQNDSFMLCIVTFGGLFLTMWFMGFGIGFIIRLFIKILRKGI